LVVSWVRRHVVVPLVVPVVASIIAAICIVGLGKILLHYYDNTLSRPDYERAELPIALGVAFAVLIIATIVATRPKGNGPLDREIVVGDRPLFAPEPPPPAVSLRQGQPGTIADIKPGDTLYARNGALARVVGLLPGGEDHGRHYRGFIYATGLYGASDELWIPVEAVMAVYPGTHSVFLAIKGDETETFGWDRPPEGFVRTPPEQPAVHG